MSGPVYPASSIVIHWLTVLFIVAAFGLGMTLENPPAGWGDRLYLLHWSVGLTILVLTAGRLANRLIKGAPPPYAGLTTIERALSQVVHVGLYVMLFVAPVLGWLGKSAYGGEISYFGTFNFPALVAQDDALAKQLLGAHKIAVKVLLALIVLHIAGALNHWLVKKDGVMRRMSPHG